MRQGAQTRTPPGVCEKPAVLRQTAFCHFFIGCNAHRAADSQVFRSQALAGGSNPAVNFSGNSGTRLRHAPDNAAYRRLTPPPVEKFHLFSSFNTYLHVSVIALISGGARPPRRAPHSRTLFVRVNARVETPHAPPSPPSGEKVPAGRMRGRRKTTKMLNNITIPDHHETWGARPRRRGLPVPTRESSCPNMKFQTGLCEII